MRTPGCETAVGFGADQRDKTLKNLVIPGSRARAVSQPCTTSHTTAHRGALSRYDAEGFGKLVWDSRRQVPFVSVDHEGSLMEHGVIRVPSLATSDLAPVYAKLAEIDSGDHRLVR